MITTEELVTLVEEILNKKGRQVKMTPETSLFTSGLLDSVSSIELIIALKKRFGVDLYVDGFEMADIDSVKKIHLKLARNHK